MVNYTSQITGGHFHQLFEEQVRKTPNNTALVFQENTLTYAELNRRANRLASKLRDSGVVNGSIVGIFTEKSFEMIIGIIGIMKAGCAYLPLDPAYPRERLEYLVDDTQTDIILSHDQTIEKLDFFDNQIINLDAIWMHNSCNAENLNEEYYKNDQLAYVIYTSGSTGKPKGVMIDNNALCSFVETVKRNYLTQSCKVLQFSSLSFDASVFEIFPTLASGAKLYLAPREQLQPGPKLEAILRDNAINFAFLPPSVLAAMDSKGFPDLEMLFVGGEASSLDIVKRWGPGRKLFNIYGPTEATVFVTIKQLDPDISPTNLGDVMPGMEVYLLDKNQLPVKNVDEIGEIFIGGPRLSIGYLNLPDLSSEKFTYFSIPNKSPGKYYSTGDFGRLLPTGEIDFIGRKDTQVKIRGIRIELSEIEKNLLTHQSVANAVVMTRNDALGEKQIVSYVMPKSDEISLTSIELRNFLQSILPLHMIPGSIVIIDTFPLTPHGKVDRKQLEEHSFYSENNVNYEPPITSDEKIMVKIWQEVLGYEYVGIKDSFFELGGHSLLAGKVISRIRNTFNVDFTMDLFFKHPTISQAIKIIRKEKKQNFKQSPILKKEYTDCVPASIPQEQLVIVDQFLGEKQHTYNIPLTYHLKGELNVEIIKKSIQFLIDRHEILRTNFTISDDEVYQVINSNLEAPFELIDISMKLKNAQEKLWSEILIKSTQLSFDLSSDPLLRVKLIKLGSNEYILFFLFHHVIFDGWSVGILQEELSEIYKSYIDGRKPILKDINIQYADFSLSQKEWEKANDWKKPIEYWKNNLKEIPTLLELPTDFSRPPEQSYNGASYSFIIPKKGKDSLDLICKEENVTLQMLLLTVFNGLLYRYTGKSDLVVGAQVAGRQNLETEPLIGYFVNTLLIRTTFENSPTWRELLQQVKQTALNAFKHQDVPFYKLLQSLQPERSLSYNPLFQIAFIMQNSLQFKWDLPLVEVDLIDIECTTSKFDLSLIIEERNNELILKFEYNTDLFNRDTISRFASHYNELLKELLKNIDTKIFTSTMLTNSELELFNLWNNTLEDSKFNISTCIHNLIEEQVKKTPNLIALKHGPTSITYKELNEQANQVANFLINIGIKPDMLIGISMNRSISLVINLLGILKAGAAYLPLDPFLTKERKQFMINDAELEIVLIDQKTSVEWDFEKVKTYNMDQFQSEVIAFPKKNIEGIGNAKNRSYVIYTSGSTGQPKGVEIEHHSVSTFLQDMQNLISIDNKDVFLAVTTFSFDISVLELFLPLTVGAKVVIASSEEVKDGSMLLNLLVQDNITMMQATPSTWQMLLAAGWEKNHKLTILSGGEALNRDLALQLMERSKNLWNLYGPTETTIWSTATQIKEINKPIPIGRPLKNEKVFILDSNAQRVPIGVKGELYIGGSGVGRGYLKRTKLSSEKFVPNPMNKDKEDRVYRTGDMARFLSNGNIEYLGRTDDQVKINGFRIELGEIENSLLEHESISQATVIVKTLDSSQRILVAYIIENENNLVSENDVRNFLKMKLPHYMIPTRIFSLKYFPLTTSGKIDKNSLLKINIEEITNTKTDIKLGNLNSLDNELIQIWSEVLCTDIKSTNLNFFELGGNSLLATQIISRIRLRFKVELKVRDLFNLPTIEQFSSYVENIINNSEDNSHSKNEDKLNTIQELNLENLSDEEIELMLLQIIENN